jgi:hypothetical protein
MNKKILYIEISTAHTEIISSFVEALIPEYDVVLLLNEKSVSRLSHLAEKIEVRPLNEKNYLNEILEQKKKIQPDLILLNSSQGRKIRDLCLRLLFDRTPIIGIHHNAENIHNSFTQKIIHFKIKKYIVLADFIKHYLEEKLIHSKIKIESFYPLIYPTTSGPKLQLNQKYISIPGVIEQDRRDYLGLIEIIQKHHTSLDPEIQFVLLGNSKNHNGPEVSQLIYKYKLESRFILFEQYVEDHILLQYIEKSKGIMPLLHPGTRWFNQYFETKISGAYSLAFCFDKILFMHQVFEGKDEFKDYGLFYDENNFVEKIKDLFSATAIQKQDKFKLQKQKNKLLYFIKDN